MPSSTTPVLAQVDASDFPAIVEALKKDGCVIIKNLTTPEIVGHINDETRPYLLADKPWKVNTSNYLALIVLTQRRVRYSHQKLAVVLVL